MSAQVIIFLMLALVYLIYSMITRTPLIKKENNIFMDSDEKVLKSNKSIKRALMMLLCMSVIIILLIIGQNFNAL